jgi:PEGA domain-containing protein
MRRVFGPLAVSLALSLGASPTFAQSGGPSQVRTRDASSHFDRGATFYSEGDYAAALVEFKRAYEASPTWQVLLNIGQSYFQLRDYANALVTLQRFASEGGERIGKEDRATLDAELPDLADRVATVTVTSNLDGATISVDDLVVGPTPLRDPVLISAGSRRITASYEGRAPVQQRIGVGGRDALAVRLDFPPLVTSPPAAIRGESPMVDRRSPSSPTHVPTYLSFLVAGGGLVVGSIFGVMAIQEKASLDRVCSPSKACPMTSQSDINSLVRNGTISTVGFGVGIVGVAAGLAFWLALRPSSGGEPSAPPRSSAGVKLGPGFLAGSF